MSRMALAQTLAALALAAGGCAPQSPSAPQAPSAPQSLSAPAAAPTRGKPGAPVAIDARVAAGSAHVTVRFDVDAADVRVDVRGAEGLTITSAAVPLEKTDFARGESAAFDVSFAPGPGRSFLAVSVEGRFHGDGRRATVVSFPVGEPTPEQRRAGGTVVEDADGERIKILGPGK